MEKIVNFNNNRIETDKGTILDFPFDLPSNEVSFNFFKEKPSDGILMHGTVYKKQNNQVYISFGGLLGQFNKDIEYDSVWLQLNF